MSAQQYASRVWEAWYDRDGDEPLAYQTPKLPPPPPDEA